jgi:hypothetical protein
MLGFRFVQTILIGFVVLSAVIKKSSVFWIVRLCRSEAVRLAFCLLLLSVLLDPDDGGDMFRETLGSSN